jgi:hypothetical protein
MPESRFPSLSADANLAEVQVRQTLAMGLVPLGISLLLMAGLSPSWPPPGLWVGALATLGGMGGLWALWRRAGRSPLRGFSTAHFLVRYLFLALCPWLLWTVYGEVVLATAGAWPPVLAALLLALYPAERILRERLEQEPERPRRIVTARIACRCAQALLGIFAAVGMLAGAVADAHRDFPTDPTPLLLFLWLLALFGALLAIVAAAAQWKRLFGGEQWSQPLDDPPPAPPPPEKRVRFGSERF